MWLLMDTRVDFETATTLDNGGVAPAAHRAVASGILDGTPARIRTANGGEAVGWAWSNHSYHNQFPVFFLGSRVDGHPMLLEFGRWHGWDGVGTAAVELLVLDGPEIDPRTVPSWATARRVATYY
jgi:hypothetical protein